jgi:hypothetical protein
MTRRPANKKYFNRLLIHRNRAARRTRTIFLDSGFKALRPFRNFKANSSPRTTRSGTRAA